MSKLFIPYSLNYSQKHVYIYIHHISSNFLKHIVWSRTHKTNYMSSDIISLISHNLPQNARYSIKVPLRFETFWEVPIRMDTTCKRCMNHVEHVWLVSTLILKSAPWAGPLNHLSVRVLNVFNWNYMSLKPYLA